VLVGTMWCAYVFGAIALISLPDNIHSTRLLNLRISSSFLQLVLLPIIIVGQNIQSRAADARATKTFEDVEDARNKVEHAFTLLTIHTEGGLHDAVAAIIDAINGKAAASGAPGRRHGFRCLRGPPPARPAPAPARHASSPGSPGSTGAGTAGSSRPRRG
jgi:hypothetical protein